MTSSFVWLFPLGLATRRWGFSFVSGRAGLDGGFNACPAAHCVAPNLPSQREQDRERKREKEVDSSISGGAYSTGST